AEAIFLPPTFTAIVPRQWFHASPPSHASGTRIPRLPTVPLPAVTTDFSGVGATPPTIAGFFGSHMMQLPPPPQKVFSPIAVNQMFPSEPAIKDSGKLSL